jgi:hypothetical protein
MYTVCGVKILTIFEREEKMKRKSIVLTAGLVVLQLCYSSLWARPTTEYEAEMVVTGWLKADARPLGTALAPEVMMVETFTDAYVQPVYYIVYLQEPRAAGTQPSGFVIVSADDLVEPIIGFADDGFYDPSPENPLGALVTNDLNGRIAAIYSTFSLQATLEGSNFAKDREMGPVEKPTVTETQSKWNHFISLAEAPESGFGLMGQTSISDVRVDALVQSEWGQSTAADRACYNYYTPRLVGDRVSWDEGHPDNFRCGCVATAMAQLIRYHEYPDRIEIETHDPCQVKVGVKKDGKFESRAEVYRWLLGGTGLNGAYEWDKLVLKPDRSTSVNERRAIGALCYDAGVSVNMKYTADGSSASPYRAAKALVRTFQYNNAVIGSWDSLSETDGNKPSGLNGMVNPNLDAGNPVILGIKRPGGGHSVVCDGYGYNSLTLYHHLNMGWYGQDDIWYNLPTIDCDDPGPYDTITTCIYNIFKPDNGEIITGEIISGRVIDASGNPISDATVTAQEASQPVVRRPGPVLRRPGPVLRPATTVSVTNSNGIYALVGVNSGATYTVSITKTGYNFTPPYQTVTTGTSTDGNDVSGNKWEIDFEGVLDVQPTSRPVSLTRCPVIETICGLIGVPTECGSPVETQCPAVETECPATETECPRRSTRCPARNTRCPPEETECPPIDTRCPPSDTECPAWYTLCPPYVSRCTVVDTQCSLVGTMCPESTKCPVESTKCPTSYTSCPPTPTNCVVIVTECVGYYTQCWPCDSGGTGNSVGEMRNSLSAGSCPAIEVQCPSVVPKHMLTETRQPVVQNIAWKTELED